MPYAAAVSELPDAGRAAAEAAEAILRSLGAGPDVVVAFFTTPHVDSAGDLAAVVRERLDPGVLIGSSAVSVVAGGRELEQRPAVSLWAGRLDGATPARFIAYREEEGAIAVEGPEHSELAAAHTLMLLPDPFTFPVDQLVRRLADQHPELTVIGGLASAAMRPGGNRLLLNGAVHDDGAVGLLLSGSTTVTTVVSQGCRPIGRPLVVTKADGNAIHELAGRPAYEQLAALFQRLDTGERRLAAQGLHIGRVIDEHKDDFDRGDFLIRAVMGADADTGVLMVGDVVPVGATVQFQVRDAGSADEDLRALMAGQSADGALLFTCNGRGTNMFPAPDHDAGVVTDVLDAAPLGGMFCAGEVGPVGDRSFVHGYTASLALFHDA